jgi:plastocyanin
MCHRREHSKSYSSCPQQSRILMQLLAVTTIVIALALLSLPSALPAKAQGSNEATVTITGIEQPPGFLPALLTVHVGETIVFVNKVVPGASYQVLDSNHAFSSPIIAPGQQWSLSISTPGTYLYHDPSHPQQMVGELNVVSTSTNLLPPLNLTVEATLITGLKKQKASSNTTTPPTNSRYMTLIIGSIAILIVLMVAVLLFRRTSSHKRT